MHLHLKSDAGVARIETLQELRDHLAHEGLRNAEADVAFAQSFERLDFRAHAVRLALEMVHVPRHEFARRRQAQGGAAPATLEQGRAQLLLEQGDLSADGGRRHVKPLRGATDGARPDHFCEIAQRHRGAHHAAIHACVSRS